VIATIPGTIGITQTVTATLSLVTPGEPVSGNINSTPTSGALPTKGNVALQLYIVVRQRAWMRILVDGKESFQGRVLPGNAYTFTGDKQIELLTSNGAALQVYYNQADTGILGALGEVVMRIYSLEGVLTPTASLVPTAQPTPKTTATSAASQAVPSTQTPLPTSTLTATPTRKP